MLRPQLLAGATIIVLLVLYAGLAPAISWPLYYRFLFAPKPEIDTGEKWKALEEQFLLDRRSISLIAEDGSQIEAVLLKLRGAHRVFLVSQGKGSTFERRAGMAAMLLKNGGSVFFYNYRGCGKSRGEPSLVHCCQDAISAYDFLRKEGFAAKSIIAYGESFGTGVTGQLVSQRPVGGVVLQSGFTSLPRASKDLLPWLRLYPVSLFPAPHMDNISVFSRPHPPLLIVHGAKDQLVSCKNAEELFAFSCEPKSLLILPSGNHGAFGKGNEYFLAMQTFLKSNKL